MRVKELISQLFYRLHLVFSEAQLEVFVPTEYDYYLVSYPRSGNTWVRVLLAELLYKESGDNLKELQYYIPDIHVRTHADEIINTKFHIVKSHEKYCKSPMKMEKYKRVIYLIRDPRDVVLSHHRYHRNVRGYSEGFEYFLVDWLNGRVWPCSWQEHVCSWTKNETGSQAYELHIIRYEDLLSAPSFELRKVADFLGVQTTDQDIERAVFAASPENMRLKEKRGMPEGESVQGFHFIGEAKAKQWKDRLQPNQIDLIVKYAGDLMTDFKYL